MRIIYFLYLNVFAFLLISLGVIVFVLPDNIFLIIIKTVFILMPLISGFGILLQWKTKNRRLKILIARNKRGIRLNTFESIRGYPCGWVLADVALRELRKEEKHKSFSKEQWKDIRFTILGIGRKNIKCFKSTT